MSQQNQSNTRTKPKIKAKTPPLICLCYNKPKNHKHTSIWGYAAHYIAEELREPDGFDPYVCDVHGGVKAEIQARIREEIAIKVKEKRKRMRRQQNSFW